MNAPRPANSLLDREPPATLVDEWTERIAAPKDPAETEECSQLVIFRRQEQWFALPAVVFDRVSIARPIRWIPFRANKILSGLVNLDGELILCVSLETVLGLTETQAEHRSSFQTRLCVLRDQQERVAFEVDELTGQRNIRLSTLKPTPGNISTSSETHTDSFFTFEDHLVALLDARKFFASLKRLLSW